jgi:hypothetical protein
MKQSPIFIVSALASPVVHKYILVELLLLSLRDWPIKISRLKARVHENITYLMYHTKTFVNIHIAAIIDIW